MTGSASANLTTLSLINIEECDIPQQIVNSSKIYVQLLQLNDFKSVNVIQCKIEIDRTIKKCGMFSHTMDVHNGQFSYIAKVSREACQRMHIYGSFEIAGTHVTGLKSNQTSSRPIILAGHVDHDGACAGSVYSDPYGIWSSVIVLGSIKITLQDYVVDVRINTNRVHLRSGGVAPRVTCELSATRCTDIEGGDTFWEPVPIDNYKFADYGVLYNGYANKILDASNERSQTVYSLTTPSMIFSLTSTGKYSTCGHTLIRTEHPKLIIFETTLENAINPTQVGANLAGSKTLINSKFVYVERHMRIQVNQLYRDILGWHPQCQLEYRMIQNSLAITARSPDVFAYYFMKGPGYMALLAGEVIHIVKCVPVEVKIARTTECYEQLPVLRANETYFLTPQTHMFPAEWLAILNTIARGILGRTTVLNGGSLSNLIDEATIERIAISAWTKFWSKFLVFGNISAGIIGIYMIARLIKLLLDTFVHGYALHSVYGWSVYLIGAICLLLHLGKDRPKKTNNVSVPNAPEHEETDDTETLILVETDAKMEYTYPLHPTTEATTSTPSNSKINKQQQ
ncbi:hypothetical protein ALC57_15695 [Trachymyrmex cornetzi]|uniref:Glycoprotein n=1 Tax=Trachymyrmex cornetzi TaxID=471704 RepID=A0A151IWH8_9HYME|nr:hypothetical protein ALC57_15695 [Trachymyrmex cornetzi]